jgi:hypothetical protein
MRCPKIERAWQTRAHFECTALHKHHIRGVDNWRNPLILLYSSNLARQVLNIPVRSECTAFLSGCGSSCIKSAGRDTIR